MDTKMLQTQFLRRMVILPGTLALALLLAGAPSAHAADDGQVAVGGVSILTVRYPAGGLTVKQRADKVTERLVTILGDPNLKPADVQAIAFGKSEARIMVKNKLLYTVDAQTAKADDTTPLRLAQSYVTRLRRVLPSVNVKPDPNLGEPAGNSR